MKFKTLATTTSALLAASLMSYGETHEDDARLPGQADRDAAAPAVRDTTAGARSATPQPAQRDTAEIRTPADIAAQFDKWEDAEMTETQLANIPERVRNAINSAAGEDKVEDEVGQLSDQGDKLFVAKISSSENADRRIFVKEDGTLAATLHDAEFSSAPPAVQAAMEEEPEEFHRISVNGQNHFIAKMKDGDEVSMVLISNTGEKIKLKSKAKDHKDD